uniref:Uncharacterized protein n=1 Tax=Romanomermis culicivorax TaxID=13658 RepID=A0A915K5M5_ROMCU
MFTCQFFNGSSTGHPRPVQSLNTMWSMWPETGPKDYQMLPQMPHAPLHRPFEDNMSRLL